MKHIPYFDLKSIQQEFEPMLSEQIRKVIQSGWYLNGEILRTFEQEFAAYLTNNSTPTNTPLHCIGVANGLDALTLILMAYKELEEWGNDAEVIVPAFTFTATALAVRRANLTIKFCDVDHNYLLSPASLLNNITSKTVAVIPVHLYGLPYPMETIESICNQHSLKIIEDAAQAHGAYYKNKRIGTLGDAAAFSFYPGKNLGALGDGGAVTTYSLKLATMVRALANYGAKSKYQHEWAGMNSRLCELQAAALLTKLPFLDKHNAKRKEIASIYNKGITNPHISTPNHDISDSVFHIYPIRCQQRDKLQQYLTSNGVETLVHYPVPIHHQPPYADYSNQSFPNSESAAKEELSLPMGPHLSVTDAIYIVETINKFQP